MSASINHLRKRQIIMSDSTPLDALLAPPGAAAQSAPPLPPSTTYTPMVTPGTLPYTPPAQAPSQPATPYVKHILRQIVTYVSVFLAVFVLSLPAIQSLGLRYVPNAYSASGCLSVTGAAIVGVAAVVLAYFVQSFLVPILV